MEKEEWRDIKDYEGYYQVSNQGRVKSVERVVVGHGARTVIERILKPKTEKNGYLRVSLCKYGKAKMYTIHRLAATAFIPNPDNLPQINHRDEDKTNNAVDNLEWCDSDYNINYGTHNERLRKAVSKPVLCVELSKIFQSAKDAGKWLGTRNYSIICKCCRGEKYSYTAYGYHWKYVTKEMDFTLF